MGRKILLIVGLIILVIIIINFLIARRIGAYVASGFNMEPEVPRGSIVFFDKDYYKFLPPKRGDIILFKFPLEYSRRFISRIVAFENETVEIKNKRLVVNGLTVEEPPIFKNLLYNNAVEGSKSINMPFKVPGVMFLSWETTVNKVLIAVIGAPCLKRT